MAKVAVQLQSQGEFSLGSGVRQQSQMTELEDESWNGWMPRIAGLEIWSKCGKGWGMGGVALVVHLKPL